MLKLRFLAVLLVLAAFAGVASAQSGSIQGTVADNSGAVVQGADVIVRSIETNAQRAVSTSASGVYSVPNLPVGHYEITVKKESFKAYHLERHRTHGGAGAGRRHHARAGHGFGRSDGARERRA